MFQSKTPIFITISFNILNTNIFKILSIFIILDDFFEIYRDHHAPPSLRTYHDTLKPTCKHAISLATAHKAFISHEEHLLFLYINTAMFFYETKNLLSSFSLYNDEKRLFWTLLNYFLFYLFSVMKSISLSISSLS